MPLSPERIRELLRQNDTVRQLVDFAQKLALKNYRWYMSNRRDVVNDISQEALLELFEMWERRIRSSNKESLPSNKEEFVYDCKVALTNQSRWISAKEARSRPETAVDPQDFDEIMQGQALQCLIDAAAIEADGEQIANFRQAWAEFSSKNPPCARALLYFNYYWRVRREKILAKEVDNRFSLREGSTYRCQEKLKYFWDVWKSRNTQTMRRQG